MLLLSGGLWTELLKPFSPREVFRTLCNIAFWTSVPRPEDLVFLFDAVTFSSGSGGSVISK